MEDHLTLTATINQFLDDQKNTVKRTEIAGVQLLKMYSALEAIQSAAEVALEHLQIGLHTSLDISGYWYVAFHRCDEVSETVTYGYSIGETNAMVSGIDDITIRQTNELIRHLNKTSRKVDEIYEGLGYLVR